MLKVLRQALRHSNDTRQIFLFHFFIFFFFFFGWKTMERDERKMHVAGFRFRSIAFHCTAKFRLFRSSYVPFHSRWLPFISSCCSWQKIGEIVYGSLGNFLATNGSKSSWQKKPSLSRAFQVHTRVLTTNCAILGCHIPRPFISHRKLIKSLSNYHWLLTATIFVTFCFGLSLPHERIQVASEKNHIEKL